MGISTKKSKSTQNVNQNTSMTTTPNNPEWVTKGIEGLGGRISQTFANLDPYSLVAGPNGLQNQAAAGASRLGQFGNYGGGGGQMDMSNPAFFSGGGDAPRGMGPTTGLSDYFATPKGQQDAAMYANLGMNIGGGPPTKAATLGGGITGSAPGGPQTYDEWAQTEQGRMALSGTADNFGGGEQEFAAKQSQRRAALAPTTGDPYTDATSTFNNMRSSGANTYDPTTGQATMGTATTGQSASLLDGLQNYMNPYINDVVDTSLAGFDQDRNLTRQQQMLDLGGDDTFGGSGGSILRALTEGQLGLSRGQLESGLRSDAFNTGAMLSGQDADRRQGMTLANMNALNTQGLANQAASNAYGLANMGALNNAGQFNAGQRDTALNRQMAGAQGLVSTANSQQEQQRQNITSQSAMGDILRQIEQQRRMAPVAALGLEQGLWSGLPLDLFKGQTANGSLTGTTVTKGKESGAALTDWLDLWAQGMKAASSGGGG